MYPHSIGQLLRNGEPINRIKSKMLNNKLKDEIIQNSFVVKEPDK